MYSIKEHMKRMEKILKSENYFFTSEIDGLPDLLWSMGARCIYPCGEELIRWFNEPVPAFENRSPLSIFKQDGEEALFECMLRLPA